MRTTRHSLNIALALILATGAAWAAPQVEVDGWPAGDRWSLEGYRRAVRKLMTLAVAQAKLPRLEAGPAQTEFERFLAPFIDPAHQNDMRVLIELAHCVDKARRVYIAQLGNDKTYGREAGAFVGVQSRLATRIADLSTAPANARFRPAAYQVVTACLVGMAAISREPGAKGEDTALFVKLMDGFLDRALSVLPAGCRREAVVLLGLDAPMNKDLPDAVVERLARIREAGTVRLAPALERLMQRGMPAAERQWMPEDVGRGAAALKATPREELPRLGGTDGAPLKRMVESSELVWIDDEDFPIGDRAMFVNQAMQGYIAARGAYTPIFTVRKRNEPEPDFDEELIAIDAATLDTLCRLIVLQEKVEAALPVSDPSTYFKKLGFAASRRMRPSLLLMLIRTLRPLEGRHPEARVKYLKLLARGLPAVLGTLTDDGRGDVVAAVRELASRKASRPVADAYAELEAVVTPPASPPARTPPPKTR